MSDRTKIEPVAEALAGVTITDPDFDGLEREDWRKLAAAALKAVRAVNAEAPSSAPSIDLEAIKARAEAATPGPWWHEWVDGDDWWAVYGQPTGDMVCPEVCTTWSSDEAAYIAAANPAVVLGLAAEIERLTGEPTEDEVERAAKALRGFSGGPR